MVFQGLEECAVVSKLERERSALAAAEKELEERRQKLAELEREEAERELNRLIKKVGQDTAIALLELAVKVKPKVAISALEKLGSVRSGLFVELGGDDHRPASSEFIGHLAGRGVDDLVDQVHRQLAIVSLLDEDVPVPGLDDVDVEEGVVGAPLGFQRSFIKGDDVGVDLAKHRNVVFVAFRCVAHDLASWRSAARPPCHETAPRQCAGHRSEAEA
jgi:hypothetical protein